MLKTPEILQKFQKFLKLKLDFFFFKIPEIFQMGVFGNFKTPRNCQKHLEIF
jgi:hypothetical protein